MTVSVNEVAATSLSGLRSLHRRRVAARGGAAGELADILFDDERWAVRYLVVDTVHAMPRRDVLVAPAQVEAMAPSVQLRLSREELKACHDLDEDRPVYLQYDMHGSARPADPHLRSGEIILGSAVRERGRPAGRLNDIEIDTEHWTIAALIVESGVWLPGERRPVDPHAVRTIDWLTRTIDLA
jgi:hypothetical protein